MENSVAERIIVLGVVALIGLGLLALGGYITILLIRALRKYIHSGPVREERTQIRRSLGEAIRAHRMEKQMTQEFVAESLGVSRQAVSKWESGAIRPQYRQPAGPCQDLQNQR